jgi:hypothetical protein
MKISLGDFMYYIYVYKKNTYEVERDFLRSSLPLRFFFLKEFSLHIYFFVLFFHFPLPTILVLLLFFFLLLARPRVGLLPPPELHVPFALCPGI